MSVAALFTIAKGCKQQKYLSTEECKSKLWYTHTMEYYSVIKRKGILTHAITWMNLEDVMISERNQSQKDK